MILKDPNEKFSLERGILVGNRGTVVDDFTEIVYCDPSTNYTKSFGFQWNKFAQTQVDRFQHGLSQSKDRFFAVTRWNDQDLTGKNVLEVGSGAGRFSSIVLQNTAANLYSVDYSDAVEANFRNNGPHNRLKIFQASIYDLPFQPQQFDKVFCFGVLQHTPDVKQSVQCLVDMVKPGGELIIDFYPVKGWYTRWHAKYWLRPITRRMSHERLLGTIEKYADFLIRTYRLLTKSGLRVLTRFVPVCDIDRTLPEGLDAKTLREWVVLDTFDMFSPAYDQPQRLTTVTKWFDQFGMTAVEGGVIRYGTNHEVTVVKGIKG